MSNGDGAVFELRALSFEQHRPVDCASPSPLRRVEVSFGTFRKQKIQKSFGEDKAKANKRTSEQEIRRCSGSV